MRHLVCHFEDGATFLRHLDAVPGESKGAPTLKFLGDFGIPTGEVVRITVVIDDAQERHDLHLKIADRRPSLADDGGHIRWRYDARPTSADAPWLEMLARKFHTAQRLTA